MELVICLVLAVSAFLAVITCIIGLVSAPTPILLSILVMGMLFTQKSIAKFNDSSVTMDDRAKNKVEKVEIASNNISDNMPQMTANIEEIEDIKDKKSSMTYRGFHYNRLKYSRLKNIESAPFSKGNVTYRGAKSRKEIV